MKTLFLTVLLLMVIFVTKAQILTPNGTINGSSGNNNVAIGFNGIPYAPLTLGKGDNTFGKLNRIQIAFTYNGTGNYRHFITTRHDAGGSGNNAIEFFTCDGSQFGTFPINAKHGMTIENGKVGIGTGKGTNPSNRLTIYSSTMGLNYANRYNAGIRLNDGTTDMFIDGNELFTSDKLYLGSESGEFVFNKINTNNTVTEFLRINPSGNVGIGLSSPAYKLHVGDRMKLDGASAGMWLEAGTNDWFIGRSGSNLRIYNRGDRLTLLPDGKVGIGTSSPNSPLTINNSSGGRLLSLIDTENNESSANPYMAFYYGSTPNRLGYVGYGSTNNNDIYLTNDVGGIKLRDNTGEVMYINDGKVGIGTLNPGEMLDVIGTIRAREVLINLDGADFVFEPGYKLMTLNELEKFIKLNNHLPEIAPASEMQSEGAKLGELNTKLLQKIEELTLYTIEQEKKIQMLETQNEEICVLKEENKIIKEQLAEILKHLKSSHANSETTAINPEK